MILIAALAQSKPTTCAPPLSALPLSLLFIQVIKGLQRNTSREEAQTEQGSNVPCYCCWDAVFLPTLFVPFSSLPVDRFPKTKEYKADNTFTTHWRRQAEVEGLHYLVTVETAVSLTETGVSIPPGSHCGGQQQPRPPCLSHSLTLSSSLRLPVAPCRSLPPSFITSTHISNTPSRSGHAVMATVEVAHRGWIK